LLIKSRQGRWKSSCPTATASRRRRIGDARGARRGRGGIGIKPSCTLVTRELHLSLQKDYRAAPFNVAHMMVRNVDALHALRQSHGLRIVKGLRDKDYGLRAFVFEDLDGNRIDVGQPIKA